MVDLASVGTAPRVAYAGTAFRSQAPSFDPHSGEGARINGGRFTLPGSYSTLYLCETLPCVVAEFTRQATRHVVGVEGLLPRVLYRYQLDLSRVLDLTDPTTQRHISITVADLVADDWTICQQVGMQARNGGDQAIRTYSVTGVDTVVAVFPDVAGHSLTAVDAAAHWNTPGDLPMP